MPPFPKNHWDFRTNQQRFFDEVGKILGVKKPEEWYNVRKSQVIDRGGIGILSHFGGSLASALQSAYPEHSWTRNLFKSESRIDWKNHGLTREYLLDLFKTFQMKHPEDWYQLSKDNLRKYGGIGLLRIHHDSMHSIMITYFPEQDWKVWRFGNVPTGFWKDRKHHREFFDDIGVFYFNIKKLDDWYKVSSQKIISCGGAGILASYYNNSVATAISSVYPEHKWRLWLFEKVPNGYWEDRRNHRLFMEYLAEKLELDSRDEWSNVTIKQVQDHGGGGLLQVYYGSSLFRALPEIYPEYHWTFMRSRMPKGYWDDFTNRKEFFDGLSKTLHFSSFEDWYTVSHDAILKNGGAGLFNEVNNHSYIKALLDVYPNYDWKIWRFSIVPNGYWSSGKHIRSALKDLYEHLGFEEWEDWYQVKSSDFTSFFGPKFLKTVNTSPMNMLMNAFPEHHWHPWKFLNLLTTHKYWDSDDHAIEFLEWISRELDINKLDDWFNVSAQEFRLLGGGPLLIKYNGLYGLLSRYYPTHNWEKNQRSFHRDPSKLHILLFKKLKDVLPGSYDVFINYSHPKLQHEKSKKDMELDLFIPQLELAFEFHGEQHYEENHAFAGDLSKMKERDAGKRKACSAIGVTLIEIPYWFFTSGYSPRKLKRLIKSFKPDVELE